MSSAADKAGNPGAAPRPMRITDLDRRILNLLEQDSRRTVSDMAKRIGVSRAAVKDRMLRLQDAGIIKRFTVDIAAEAVLAEPIGSAFLLLTLHRASCKTIHEAIRGWPEVLGCWSVAGDLDMVILVAARSHLELDDLRDRLARHPLVKSLTTQPVLRDWAHRPTGMDQRIAAAT